MDEFRQALLELERDDLIEIIKKQDPNLYKGVNRIEWVFENKLKHLTWPDGSQISKRPLTKEELALLIDEPFEPREELTDLGITFDQQRQMHIAKDPVLWCKHYLNVNPRVYQILIMRHPNNRKVLRAGRRLGKTWSMAALLLHYAFTHNHGRCLVIAPMKAHVELIYDEVVKLASTSNMVSEAITRKVTSPQFSVTFSNGSTIRFFTSGIRSGGKTDVARGQEAHFIILDELDMMTNEDLEALYAMLQQTQEDQPEKQLIGASTPTGRREKFWEWCNAPHFKEFWFPSYCMPYFDAELEEELRNEYTTMGYRHEIEADWGEDTQGVYARKFVDLAFASGRFIKPNAEIEEIKELSDWEYRPEIVSARSDIVLGVDWDKYEAGCNIVALEICQEDHEDERAAGRLKLLYREEIPKSDYTLTNATNRVIQLNATMKPKHIYVDRGYGETQVELLHRHGVENPETGLRKKVKGIAFGGTVEVRDPSTKQKEKKEMKPFMVDNLVQMLERENIIFPSHDVDDRESLYLQLISYVVARVTPIGRPVFEATGNVPDHAHDALLLACLAVTENYSDLMKAKFATRARSISNDFFLPLIHDKTKGSKEDVRPDPETSEAGRKVTATRAASFKKGGHRRASNRFIKRRTF